MIFQGVGGNVIIFNSAAALFQDEDAAIPVAVDTIGADRGGGVALDQDATPGLTRDVAALDRGLSAFDQHGGGDIPHGLRVLGGGPADGEVADLGFARAQPDDRRRRIAR
jgi:hypothetical protein